MDITESSGVKLEKEALYDLKEKEESLLGVKIYRNSILFILAILTLLVFIISFVIGRYPISIQELINVLTAKIFGIKSTCDPTVETVILNVRMPRIFAALIIGAALSVSGATYQGLFKNPMVSPDILGASAGAGFGAALAILMSFGIVGIQVSAFIFGISAVALTFFVSTIVGRGNNVTLGLVLTGMVVSTIFTAFISMTKYVADPDSKLPAITFWLMGGLSTIRTIDVKMIIIPMLIGVIPLILIRWKINVLSFGDEEAKALGVDTNKMRIITIICSTLLTASAVSICGMVGWVGLIIPHIARMLVGPNYKSLLPASLLLGSTFLIIVDDIARTVFAIEIPLGILTSLVGAPIFLYLMMKGRKGWI